MANEIENGIREEAKRLLESGEVTVVIGWGAGSAAFKTTPVFIDSAEDVDRLVWNPACMNNLAVYLPQVAKRAKVGIVAKPCDSRSIVTLIQEKQVPRENLTIIGVACPGIIDDAALKEAGVRLSDVQGLQWDGENVRVSTGGGNTAVAVSAAVKEACRTCAQRTPVISDVLVGGPENPQHQVVEPLDSPDSIDSSDSRRAFWAAQFEKCIRCYACRQACPSCYCAKCFADRNDVKWTSKRMQTSENWMWHMGRAMHLAGRCIACGECERVCPVGVPIMTLNREMQKNVAELFDYTPGMDPEELPALGQWEPDDKDPNEH